MFTGIVETVGTVQAVAATGGNLSFWIKSSITAELKVDQSVSHDGICLTVESIIGDQYQVTAIEETIRKSNISQWQPGKKVNLERCMTLGGRLDGHIVQGHVDATGTCLSVTPEQGSYLYRFSFPKAFNHLIIEKGSIAVSGTSLTCFDVSDGAFSVAIIPYTYEHTGISQISSGSLVNLEFDVIGKYIARMQAFPLPDTSQNLGG
ncbi:riboflavin synthase alpha chain [Arachidicoccus rhizosphaerae]|uniref:Riboflavin synthase n=1 Tax=Arachidicoccus rhizosphaerae TaxID=551991 RepID=A0A1H3Z7A5_9BACT|nr:riboflavin synthase [Arachidicoccus rhizosphaerae]SEA19586.1 riboflavin synthase alpha chain [Arachidicoccus rhizosphaerae]